jgi:hypothetical protein
MEIYFIGGITGQHSTAGTAPTGFHFTTTLHAGLIRRSVWLSSTSRGRFAHRSARDTLG